jgi:hypothetical protein
VTFGFVFAEALLADAAAGTSVLVGRAEDLPLLMGDLHGGYGSSGKRNSSKKRRKLTFPI